MKFEIFSVGNCGKSLYHVYDNVSNVITATDKNIPVYLNQDPRFLHVTKKVDNVTANRYRNVRIQLGFNCNYNCKYCHQHYNSISKVDVDNLVSRLVSAGLTTDSITLWGGEPLVHWKALKKLIPKLKLLFDCKLYMCTNGSLFTYEVATFLAKYDVHVNVSHDGPSFKRYRNSDDPLDDKDVVKAIQYYYDANKTLISFNVVITPENSDLLQVKQFLTSKINRPVSINIESIVKCDTITQNKVSQFDINSAQQLYQSLMAIWVNRDTQFNNLCEYIDDVICDIVGEKPIRKDNYGCGCNAGRYLAIDTNCNVLLCHDSIASDCELGNIDQIVHDKQIYLTSWNDREGCGKCPYLFLCKAGCPKSADADHRIACNNLKLYYSTIFHIVWFALFGSNITSIQAK